MFWLIQFGTCGVVERVEAGWTGKGAVALLWGLERVCLPKIRHLDLTLVWCRGVTVLKRGLIREVWSIRECYREKRRRRKAVIKDL